MSETIEQICQKKGVKLTDQRKIIAKVLSESKEVYGESDHPDVDELYKRVSNLIQKLVLLLFIEQLSFLKSLVYLLF